jgi:hypothetical protein
MALKIAYRRTVQAKPYESITLEVERTYDDTDKDINSFFDEKVSELEALVDGELERRTEELNRKEKELEYENMNGIDIEDC